MGTNVPDLRGRFLQENGVPGQQIEAGLPNITGSVDSRYGIGGLQSTSGAYIKRSGRANHHNDAFYDGGAGTYDFDASRSSPVYGRSDTVQPPAYTVRYLVRALQ